MGRGVGGEVIMKILLFLIPAFFLLSCWDTLSTMHGDLTMKVPVCVHFTNGNDSNDGRGWKNSKQTINGAIAAAQAGDEIWVANPDNELIISVISITKTVSIYGGFNGDESRRDERDLSRKTRINTNSYIEIKSSNIIIDGFYITGSRGNSAVVIDTGHSAVITNCEFVSNENISGSGGAINCTSGSVEVNDCIFKSNTATGGSGGAIYIDSSNVTISTSLFDGNKADSGNGGAICTSQTGVSFSIALSDSVFIKNNSSGNGGACFFYNVDDLKITGCTFGTKGVNSEANKTIAASNKGGAIYINSSSAVIIAANISDSRIFNNTATGYGGGISVGEYVNLTIDRSIISGNSCSMNGGGIAASPSVGTIYSLITNSLISDNTASTSNAFEIFSGGGSDLTIYNSTIVNQGSVKIAELTTGTVINSVLYGASIGAGTITFSYIAKNAGLLLSGTNIITIDTSSFHDFVNHNYVITSDSPCVNAGTNIIPGYTMPEYDLGGFPRISGGIVDIGAYEYQ